jgi:hypothetical protein
MTYKPIYNKYNAFNKDALKICDAARKCINEVMDEFPEFSPRDIRALIASEATYQSTIRVVKKASDMKKAEKKQAAKEKADKGAKADTASDCKNCGKNDTGGWCCWVPRPGD